MSHLDITIFWPGMIALAACSLPENNIAEYPFNTPSVSTASYLQKSDRTENIPDYPASVFSTKYIDVFTCDFDENPIASHQRQHGTPAGRAERASDLAVLRSLGFEREGRDGDLESVGGKIAAPPALTILNLPVQSLEINGMIGDANAMYVTTFGKGVTVKQVVAAARLEMDRESFRKYGMRHYSRRISSNPHIEIYLDDRGGNNALLVCQVQSTPD
jgi:hypothetical protein